MSSELTLVRGRPRWLPACHPHLWLVGGPERVLPAPLRSPGRWLCGRCPAPPTPLLGSPAALTVPLCTPGSPIGPSSLFPALPGGRLCVVATFQDLLVARALPWAQRQSLFSGCMGSSQGQRLRSTDSCAAHSGQGRGPAAWAPGEPSRQGRWQWASSSRHGWLPPEESVDSGEDSVPPGPRPGARPPPLGSTSESRKSEVPPKRHRVPALKAVTLLPLGCGAGGAQPHAAPRGQGPPQ